MTASIVSSVIQFATSQADGRTTVYELHTDSLGNAYPHAYLAAAGAVLATNLAAYAAALPASLQAAEIAANVAAVEAMGSLATVTFNWSTGAENAAGLRGAYLVSTQVEAIMIGDFLNTLTVAQLEAAFGWSATQVSALQTNYFAPMATLAESIRAAVGT